tara:strand:+ start:429 stop:647 length:219 start_codon:yes stop_codon:yes gene_type:complete
MERTPRPPTDRKLLLDKLSILYLQLSDALRAFARILTNAFSVYTRTLVYTTFTNHSIFSFIEHIFYFIFINK